MDNKVIISLLYHQVFWFDVIVRKEFSDPMGNSYNDSIDSCILEYRSPGCYLLSRRKRTDIPQLYIVYISHGSETALLLVLLWSVRSNGISLIVM